MKALIFLLLLIPSFGFSQSEICSFESQNQNLSLGLKFKISAPCNWTNYTQSADVIKLGHKEGKIAFVSYLKVIDMGETFTNEDIDEIMTERSFKENGFTELIPGEIISIKRNKINDFEGGYVIVKQNMKDKGVNYSIYILSNCLFYKDKFILLNYGVTSDDENTASLAFENNKPQFISYSNKIMLISDNH
jgi:hypothetical protein